MERRKINSLGKIALGGLAFLVFYWIVVFLYGTSVPASSGLAGAFAIGYFAIFMAVALPAIVLFVLFLIFLGKAVSPKQAVNKQSSQTPSDKKDGGDASALKMLLFISLFPLLFLSGFSQT